MRNYAFNFRRITRCLIFLGMVLILTATARTAFSANLTLAWEPNPEPDLIGYRVFCGESSGHYSITKDVNSNNPGETLPTTFEFTGLEEGKKYYFAAIALSDSGKSDYSQEISYNVPATPVDPNATDDDNDGLSENQGDCDDTDASIYPRRS